MNYCLVVALLLGSVVGSNGKRALIVIDMTNEQFVPGMPRYDETLDAVGKLMGNRNNFFDLVIDARMEVRCDGAMQSPMCRNWKGGVPGSHGAAMIEQLQRYNATTVFKPNFSAFFGTNLDTTLRHIRPVLKP